MTALSAKAVAVMSPVGRKGNVFFRFLFYMKFRFGGSFFSIFSKFFSVGPNLGETPSGLLFVFLPARVRGRSRPR